MYIKLNYFNLFGYIGSFFKNIATNKAERAEKAIEHYKNAAT